MTLVRYNPMDVMTRRWSRMMEDLASDAGSDQDELMHRVWVPRMDIVEDEQEYRLIADLPGMSKDDVDITLEDGVLTIAGERAATEKSEGDTWRQIERARGRFSRSFTVRESIDHAKIAASFKDGELTVKLPKAETSKPRKIKINA